MNALLGSHGALLVGNPEEVSKKILEHSEALGGSDRISFQMDVASLPHAKFMQAIELLGTRVAPILRTAWKLYYWKSSPTLTPKTSVKYIIS